MPPTPPVQGVHPQVGNKDPICHMVWQKKKSQEQLNTHMWKNTPTLYRLQKLIQDLKFERETNASRRKEKKKHRREHEPYRETIHKTMPNSRNSRGWKEVVMKVLPGVWGSTQFV